MRKKLECDKSSHTALFRVIAPSTVKDLWLACLLAVDFSFPMEGWTDEGLIYGLN